VHHTIVSNIEMCDELNGFDSLCILCYFSLPLSYCGVTILYYIKLHKTTKQCPNNKCLIGQPTYTYYITRAYIHTSIGKKVCFIILHITVNLSLLGFKMKFDIHSYTKESTIAFLLADFQKCAMSFMLFWTLFFGLVYLF